MSQLIIYIYPLFYMLLSYIGKYKVLGRVLRTPCICVCLCKKVTYKRVAKSICLTDSLFCQNSPSQDNHDGVITHLEPDILECEVKWALERFTMNKAMYVMEFQLSYFILKDDAVKELHSICKQFWKTQQWPQDWKRSVFIQIPKKGNAKECSNPPHNCTHLTS